MEVIGVNFLNLHQLHATKHNYKALLKRHYHFLHQPSVPVMESETSALRLLMYAKENQINLPINYCSCAYKNRFQGLDVRQRRGRVALKGCEELTDAAYIRSFRVVDSQDKILSMVKRLEKDNCPSVLWACHDRKNELAIHSDLLRYVDWSTAELTLSYSEPVVRLKNQAAGVMASNLEPMNAEVYKVNTWSEIFTECWRRLYKEGGSAEGVFEFLYQNYPLEGNKDIANLQKEMHELKQIAEWEELPNRLPEVF